MYLRKIAANSYIPFITQ